MYARAAARFAESLALARTMGESWGARSLTAILLINLGGLAMRQAMMRRHRRCTRKVTRSRRRLDRSPLDGVCAAEYR